MELRRVLFRSYELIQRHALVAWQKEGSPTQTSFFDLLRQDREVQKILSEKELKECFNPTQYLKHIDTIYRRVFEC